MITTIDQMMARAKKRGIQTIAVVCAHDEDVLQSLEKAVKEKIVKPVLIGKTKEIEKILSENSLELGAEIIECDDDAKSAEKAVRMVSEGKAQMLMKGLLATSTLLKATLNKEWGLRSSGLLSHIALFKPEHFERFIIITDAAINITPDLMQKKLMIENAVKATHKLDIELPKVALLAAVESVNPSMQATIDAAVLSKMNERGQIKGCIIDGPLAMDNAVSVIAAKHKGITSPVAGMADILVAPNIDVGNAIYKTLAFLSTCQYAGVVVGARAPIVLTSRADTPESKFNSIVFASALAVK
jgi:phosphate butyryltransferase